MDAVMLDKEDVMRLFTGLGDPIRLEIVFLLGEHERLNVGEIAANFRLSRPAISHHLKVLKDAHILRSEKVAQEVYYSLDIATVSARLRAVLGLLDECATATRAQEA